MKKNRLLREVRSLLLPPLKKTDDRKTPKRRELLEHLPRDYPKTCLQQRFNFWNADFEGGASLTLLDRIDVNEVNAWVDKALVG